MPAELGRATPPVLAEEELAVPRLVAFFVHGAEDDRLSRVA